MTAEQILELGPELDAFLAAYDECFARSEPRRNLAVYVAGQLSELQRKSAEPMALAAGIDERALQVFLAQRHWDHELLRQKMQQLVAAEHADANGIGIIDETGHPKKGAKTPGVKRQYCGNTGKIDNCYVTVHLAYSGWTDPFHTLLDSDLFLPEDWAADEERCAAAGIPEGVVYRPKWQIALEQIDRALANGVSLRWIAADEYYGSKPGFIVGVIERGLNPAVEVPSNFRGWTHPPLHLTSGSAKTSTVKNLAQHSPSLASQPWVRYLIKTTEKGPVVWEVRSMPFAFKAGKQIVRQATLIVARNVLNPTEIKYFVIVAPPGTPLADMLHAAFSRPRVEDCFVKGKDEFGLSHYEGRTYLGLLRHCYVTALTILFAMRQTAKLREKKSRGHALSNSRCDRRLGASAA